HRARAATAPHADARVPAGRHGGARRAPRAAAEGRGPGGRAGMSVDGAPAARERVLAEIRSGDRFCLVTHENPDGDALGSLVGMHRILTALGKDSVMLMSPEEFPLPYEYRFFDLEGLLTVAPADVLERTIIYLDCGNIDRSPLGVVKAD